MTDWWAFILWMNQKKGLNESLINVYIVVLLFTQSF